SRAGGAAFPARNPTRIQHALKQEGNSAMSFAFPGGPGWGRRRRARNGAGCGCAAGQGGYSLAEVAPGSTCRIRRLNGCGPIRQRLLDLGIRPDREVTVVRVAPLLDPIELKVGDSYIVLRRNEAAQVEIVHV
ncbi:MAG: ferrous iron transport protein A, partial [Rhodobacteraceae bacterium]|nr:ferrous iron transport protein A [Paracoccaceae bacterium]